MALDFRQNAAADTPAPGARAAGSEPGESGGLLPAVTMMETAHPRERNDLRSVARVVLNGTPIGSVLAEPIVRAVEMVIANVVPNQPSQVPFVQRNHMVQNSRRQLPTHRSATPFCHGDSRLVRLGFSPMERSTFRTSVSNFVSRSRITNRWCRVWECFTQLLDHPRGGRL